MEVTVIFQERNSISSVKGWSLIHSSLTVKNISPKDIMGYGASTKGNIVLNHLGITNKDVPDNYYTYIIVGGFIIYIVLKNLANQ